MLEGPKLSLKERRYKALARRYARALDQLLRAGRELGRIAPQMRRYEREFIRTGNYESLALDGLEQAELVHGPRKERS